MKTKDLRMEGYDIARKRVHSYLMKRATLAQSERIERLFTTAAEYVGVMLADYTGEPSDRAARPKSGANG